MCQGRYLDAGRKDQMADGVQILKTIQGTKILSFF